MKATEIAAALELFIAPDQFTELRAMNVGGAGRVVAGWFDGRHLLDLARAALGLTRQASRVQFIPNPIRPDVAARRLNKALDVHRGFALTRDADVIDRRWLIVDVDPWGFWRDRPDPTVEREERPSSWRELGWALRVARRGVRVMLADLGFPDPVEMLTGNGVHLVYPVEPTPAGKCAPGDPTARLLQLIGSKWNLPGVSIDPATYTPARLLKVPGTLTKKGAAAPGRPHRTSRILRVPHDWTRPEFVAPEPVAEPERKPEPEPAPPAVGSGHRERPGPGRPDRRPAPAARRAEPAAGLFESGPRQSGRPVH